MVVVEVTSVIEVDTDEAVADEYEEGGSRLSTGGDISAGLCFRKRDMKPFNPGPAEAGGLETGGGDILK